jgi:hypothetical protein
MAQQITLGRRNLFDFISASSNPPVQIAPNYQLTFGCVLLFPG